VEFTNPLKPNALVELLRHFADHPSRTVTALKSKTDSRYARWPIILALARLLCMAGRRKRPDGPSIGDRRRHDRNSRPAHPAVRDRRAGVMADVRSRRPDLPLQQNGVD